MFDPFITTKEADGYLYMDDDWLSLSKKDKEYHIMIASGYILNNWSCDEYDTTPEYIKRSCAFYSLESFKGNLYSLDPRGSIIEITDKLGSMTSTTKWESSTTTNAVKYIDDIMRLYCVSKNNNGKILYRT